jgi:hypothetical protein
MIACGAAALMLSPCGHDPAPGNPFASLTLVSAPTDFAPGCSGAPQTGTNYPNAKVEAFLAVDPTNPAHLVGVWQQDRYSNGGASGLFAAASTDGGKTWARRALRFSNCSGGNPSNGGNYERASDPWVSFSPDGTVHVQGLAFDDSNGRGRKAILVSRSADGGLIWSDPTALQVDSDPDFSVDKGSITADPHDGRYAYAVWDRLTGLTNPDPTLTTGPTWFSRAVNGTWDPVPRAIFDPGRDAQTVSNQLVVLPDGTLVNLFLEITNSSTSSVVNRVAVIRSTDKGITWSARIVVAVDQSVGNRDPKTGRPLRAGSVIPGIAVDPNSGKIYVVWQDARFSGGRQDGIALSSSTDGGLTWSAPLQVNRAPSAQAFTPSIAVAGSGKLGITYYDLRNDTSGDALLATYWLVTSADGAATWDETPVTGPFDMRPAVFGGIYFLGDYQGLVASGETFVPFFVGANAVNSANPTDVFVKAL